LIRLITLIAFIIFISNGYELGLENYKFWLLLLGFLGFFGLSIWDFEVRKSSGTGSS
jgi:hypothetical protein